MKPTLNDFMSSSAKWYGEYEGIRYELSWHSHSGYNREGIWCYYVIVTDEQFFPNDWTKLRLTKEDRQFGDGGSFHRHFDYYSFPDLDPHGEWTFGEMETYLGRDGVEHERVKVGCDYNHGFDRDSGWWEGRRDVERDAKRSIDLLVKMFPERRQCCRYSAKYDNADQFYTARNGALVHKSQLSKFSETDWPMWLPADGALSQVIAQPAAANSQEESRG